MIGISGMVLDGFGTLKCAETRGQVKLWNVEVLGSWNLLILFASLILCVAITQVAEPQRTNPTPDIHTSMRGCYGELRSTEPTCEPEVISDSWTSVGLITECTISVPIIYIDTTQYIKLYYIN
jgi:hypothetical protein